MSAGAQAGRALTTADTEGPTDRNAAANQQQIKIQDKNFKNEEQQAHCVAADGEGWCGLDQAPPFQNLKHAAKSWHAATTTNREHIQFMNASN